MISNYYFQVNENLQLDSVIDKIVYITNTFDSNGRRQIRRERGKKDFKNGDGVAVGTANKGRQ